MTTITRNGFDRTHLPATLKSFYDVLQAHPELLQESNFVTLTHAGANALPVDAYQINVVSSGGGAGDPAALPDPTTIGIIGQRHVLKLVTRTGGADTVAIDKTKLHMGATTINAVILTNAGDWLLVEHRGTVWEIVGAAAGVVS
jgi:hypothetical protein